VPALEQRARQGADDSGGVEVRCLVQVDQVGPDVARIAVARGQIAAAQEQRLDVVQDRAVLEERCGRRVADRVVEERERAGELLEDHEVVDEPGYAATVKVAVFPEPSETESI